MTPPRAFFPFHEQPSFWLYDSSSTMTTSPPLIEPYNPDLYLVHLAQIHETFRKAELTSLAVLHNIPLKWVEYSDSVHPPSPRASPPLTQHLVVSLRDRLPPLRRLRRPPRLPLHPHQSNLPSLGARPRLPYAPPHPPAPPSLPSCPPHPQLLQIHHRILPIQAQLHLPALPHRILLLPLPPRPDPHA